MSKLIADIALLCQHVTLGLTGWDEPLRRLAALTHSSRAQLIGLGGPSVAPFNWITDGENLDAERLLEIDGYSPHANFRVAVSDQGADMQVLHEEDYDAASALLVTDLYRDFCEEEGIPFGCQTRLVSGQGQLIGLATLRTRQDGRTNEDQRALFAQAAQHIAAAVRLQQQIEHNGQALLLGALDTLSASILLIDAYGRVCGVTRGADAVLTTGRRIALRDNRVHGLTPPETSRIERALAHVLGEAAPVEGVELTLPPLGGVGAMLLSIRPLATAPWNIGTIPRAMIVIGGGLPDGDRGVARLQEMFDLTEAEAAVALAMRSGRPRTDIAASRGVSIATLRSQIKSIYRKAGVSREAELLSLLFSGRG